MLSTVKPVFIWAARTDLLGQLLSGSDGGESLCYFGIDEAWYKLSPRDHRKASIAGIHALLKVHHATRPAPWAPDRSRQTPCLLCRLVRCPMPFHHGRCHHTDPMGRCSSVPLFGAVSQIDAHGVSASHRGRDMSPSYIYSPCSHSKNVICTLLYNVCAFAVPTGSFSCHLEQEISKVLVCHRIAQHTI